MQRDPETTGSGLPEADLRRLLRDGAASTPMRGLDVHAVIRASRARRLPRQVAAGGVLTLAAVGIGVGAVSGMRGGNVATSAGGSAEESVTDARSPGQAELAPLVPADRLNPCGGSPATPTSGLPAALDVNFADVAPSASGSVTGEVVLRNTGTERLSGTTAASPAITVSQNGTVLWHSNGPMIMMAAVIDLGPGESHVYQASFTPVRCEPEDELADSFRADLPPLEPGVYQLSAAIDLVDDQTGATLQIVSSGSDIALD